MSSLIRKPILASFKTAIIFIQLALAVFGVELEMELGVCVSSYDFCSASPGGDPLGFQGARPEYPSLVLREPLWEPGVSQAEGSPTACEMGWVRPPHRGQTFWEECPGSPAAAPTGLAPACRLRQLTQAAFVGI